MNDRERLPTVDDSLPKYRHTLAERLLEGTMFKSRWLLAPFYLGMVAGLVLLLVEFAGRIVSLVKLVRLGDHSGVTIGILSLIDLSLIGNLVLMVIFSGYENFVSKFDIVDHRDRPDWMGHVGFGDLKLKLMASIVAISAIQLLEAFLNIDDTSDRDLAWTLGIHLTFVLSGLLLAVMDRMMHK
jgi:uncharacterized protein (TIGR00645 family)